MSAHPPILNNNQPLIIGYQATSNWGFGKRVEITLNRFFRSVGHRGTRLQSWQSWEWLLSVDGWTKSGEQQLIWSLLN